MITGSHDNGASGITYDYQVTALNGFPVTAVVLYTEFKSNIIFISLPYSGSIQSKPHGQGVTEYIEVYQPTGDYSGTPACLVPYTAPNGP